MLECVRLVNYPFWWCLSFKLEHLYGSSILHQPGNREIWWLVQLCTYVLVPDCPAIQDITTDQKMGPSKIYRRSWKFLHWLRFQFNLSHHQLIKMNSLSPESKMTKSLQHFVIVWFSSEKCDTSLTTKEGAEYTFGQQFLRKNSKQSFPKKV